MAGAYYSKRYGYNDNWYGPTPKSHRRTSGLGFSKFLRTAATIAREAERSRRAAEQHRLKVVKEQIQIQTAIAKEEDRQSREAERNARARERDAAKQYAQQRLAETTHLNEELSGTMAEFENILPHTLSVDDTISFDELRRVPPFVEFDEAQYAKQEPRRPAVSTFLSKIKRPPPWLMWLGFVQRGYAKRRAGAQREFDDTLKAYQVSLANHRKLVENFRAEHAEAKRKYLEMASALEEKINAFESQYRAGNPDSIRDYCAMVLERSEYPESLQPDFDLDYEPKSRLVSVQMLVPSLAIVPIDSGYSYVKSRDAIDRKSRKPKEIERLYRQLLSSIALRTIHEIIEADQGSFVDAVAFSGFVAPIKGGLGSGTSREVIVLHTNKAQFLKIDLGTSLYCEVVEQLDGTISHVHA
jgi:restriction system protein